MKAIILFLLSISITTPVLGNTNEIELSGEKFLSTKLGKTHFVTPRNTRSSIERLYEGYIGELVGNKKAPDCSEIALAAPRLIRRMKRCEERPNSPICTGVEIQLYRLGEGRFGPNEPFGDEVQQAWNLGKAKYRFNEDRLLREASRKLSTSAENIVLRIEEDRSELSEMTGVLELSLDEDSLAKKVMDFLNIVPVSMIEIHSRFDALLTQNNFLSCAILSGEAELKVAVKDRIDHWEGIDEKTMSSLWKIYQRAKSFPAYENEHTLTKAALYGALLGKSSEVVKSKNDEELSIRKFFPRFYSLAGTNLQLKDYSSKENLHYAEYPDKEYSAAPRVVWSNQ